MTITPRNYLSYSQLVLFERSAKEYADRYIRGIEQYETINMAYGSLMADGLEHGEATGDPILDMMIARLPKFELMDIGFEVKLGKGKGAVPLLAKPDTARADYTAFKEYKTSVRTWTHKMANDSDQITFYAMAMWLKTGKIPVDIELVNVPVAYNDDRSLSPTGEIVRFKTSRTMVDIIKMSTRARKAWAGIQRLCEKELL